MVKPGYKQTEIGIIPEDWDVLIMDELTTLMTNGFVGTIKCEYVPSGTGVLYLQGFNVKENRFDLTGVTYVSNEFHQKHPKSELKENDLLTVQTGNIGVTAVVPKEYQGANCQALIISRFRACYDSRYWSYYFNSIGRRSLIEIETGSTMKHINVGDFKNVSVPVPANKMEQGAIAAALFDMDVLIANLEKLIAKKKAIKQGAMQELLTGKRRLPGFDGEWIVCALEELCDMFSGGTPNSRIGSYYGGDIPWVSISDISVSGKYLKNTEKTLTKDGLENSSARLYPANTLLFAMYASIGKCCIANQSVSSSQAILGMYNFRNVTCQFLYYYLSFNQKTFVEMGQTGTQSNLSKKIVQKIPVFLPELNEQIAIVNILSDMDDELNTLEGNLKKYQMIKQGMMSELLTGRIRLISKEDA